MNYHNLQIFQERDLQKELFDLFEGDVIEKVIRDAKVEDGNNSWHKLHQGTSFKISSVLAPKLYHTCTEAQEALFFTDDVEFFVTNSADANAYAVPKIEKDDKNIIVLHSRIIELFDTGELKFIIGHELGHLISHNANLQRIIRFVYPDSDRLPVILRNKISYWNKLSELSADRFGYLASPDLNACIRNFFKLSSGLDTEKIEFDSQAYLEQIDKIIEGFKESPFTIASSHPVNPIRIKAIQYFSESDLCQRTGDTENIEEKTIEDPNLQERMKPLVDMLMAIRGSELDSHRMHFIGSAGILAAALDNPLTEKEVENIVSVLGNLTTFPESFLKQLLDLPKEEILKVFQGSAAAILQQNPGERTTMLAFVIEVALADREISTQELDFIYDLGQKMFEFSKKEVAQQLAQAIRNRFVPKLWK